MHFSKLANRLLAVTGGYSTPHHERGCGSHWESRRLRAVSPATLADPFRQSPTDPAVVDLNASAPVDGTLVSGPRLMPDRCEPSPTGLPALRGAVAELTGADAEAGVLITHGVSGGYRAALDAFVDRGRGVVLLAPCSPLFATATQSHGARVRWVRTWVEGDRLRLDFDALSRAMRGAALLAIADPGNPIGLPLAHDDADRLRWTAERSDVPLYVDESYRRFRETSHRLARLAPERTLVAGSMAAYGHTGLRVGWLAGPSPLIRACGLAQSLAAGPVPSVCQRLAEQVLTSGPTEAEVGAVRAARRDATGRLRTMGFAVAGPADGYFLWADVGQNGRAFAEGLLAAEGVRVGPGDLYGPGGVRFIRLSVAGDPGRLREGLSRIARFVGAPARPVPAGRPTPARRPAFSRG